jgi:DNA end-binding protein Ku
MFFADEIRDIADVPGAEVRATATARELEIARKLIESLSGSWDHTKYEDSYRDQLLALVKKKAQGETIDVEAPEEPAAPVIDLMEALKRSLAAKPKGKGEGEGTTTARRSARAKPARGKRQGPRRARAA